MSFSLKLLFLAAISYFGGFLVFKNRSGKDPSIEATSSTRELNRILRENNSTGDPAHDLEVFREHSNSHENSSAFFSDLSKENPQAAMALLEQQPPSRDRAVSTVEVAKNWALADPDASLTWIRQETSPQIKAAALVAIASVIGGEDPQRGLALIGEIDWAETEALMQLQAVRDGKASKATTGYQNPYETIDIASSIFQSLALGDPSAARTYLDEKVPPEHRAHFETLLPK